ncbi:MAG TPA: glycerophosphodiester phosphodiesterase family protein [Actinoplanes sp.]|nr:glycerophosphodiester phosphodiesterase family protein [Actinoplanes sp.]
MRTSIVAAAALLALIGGLSPPQELKTGTFARHLIEGPRSHFLKHGPGAPVLTVAHRGDWRDAPENSVAAITKAVEGGAQIVEVDVQRTRDGELVLMHDETVDRTTDGTGRVADLTLEQIEALRLRAGLGGDHARLRRLKVPTLRDALRAVSGSGALLNLDKAWPYRDQAYELLVELDQVGQGIFKSSAPVPEVAAFLARDPRILYSHVIGDANVADVGAFADRPPTAYELVFDRLSDPQIQPAVVAMARATSRVWVNTMWKGLAARYTDAASLRDPALGWGAVVDRYGADTIQTDDPDQLLGWLRARGQR